ncbi:MAG: hypothetical protein B1H03_04415 [Planctomycetales bacterium 4484_113]|nr:MAG: hypothetical protein B1H03_04415 [Planctomycetales bacterium 4484_113]
MPHISIEGPPIRELETKRKLVEGLTEAAANAYGLRKEIITVLIKENAPENVGVGGQLLVDRWKAESEKSPD